MSLTLPGDAGARGEHAARCGRGTEGLVVGEVDYEPTHRCQPHRPILRNLVTEIQKQLLDDVTNAID